MTPGTQPSRDVVRTIAGRFRVSGTVVAAVELRSGHINDSYVVSIAGGNRVLLQRINDYVFPEPEQVMRNIVRITRHLAHRLGPHSRRRRLTMIPTNDGRMWLDIADGGAAAGWWRMYELIEDVRTELRASTPDQVFRAAQAYGSFQGMLADLPPPPLFETIPRFHDTIGRFEALDRALRKAASSADGAARGRQAQSELGAAADHRPLAGRLLDAVARGLPRRTVHNDCKISNVLFDRPSGEALCVVDLDTAMPGLAAFDFGDMARSMGHRADEDDRDPEAARVDLELFRALAHGYLEGARFLTDDERRGLVDGALVLTLEQAVRFLTDHLEGDLYFRTERPGQNLDRCRVQFALLRSLLNHEADLRRIVEEAGPCQKPG